MRYAACHAPCGAVVEDDLPDGYPVEEGVGLWCPRCREAFWHMAADDREPEPEPPTPEPEPEPEPPEQAAAPEPPTPGPPPQRRVLLRVWPVLLLIGATALAVLIVVLLVTRASGDPPRPATTPTPTPTVTATPSPAPPARVSRLLAGAAVSVVLPEGWRIRSDGRRQLNATGPGGARVRVSVAPRRGRNLQRLGRDVRAWLRPQGAAPLHRVRLGGRPAVRIFARDREATVVAVGDRRWVVERGLGAGRAIAHSVRIRPLPDG